MQRTEQTAVRVARKPWGVRPWSSVVGSGDAVGADNALAEIQPHSAEARA